VNRVEPVFVSFEGKDLFTMEAIDLYEEAIKKAQDSGTKIRAMLICNPHNPLGRCYEPEVLIGYMNLCQKYSIHLIMDEIYALSVYQTTQTEAVLFKSVLALDTENYINPNFLHILYGFSKDLASGGLRLGCIWSKNKDLIMALSAIALFCWPSNVAETIAITMLEDLEWMETFIKTNQASLNERAAMARSVLEEYNIPYASGASAGFFLWIDIRKFLGRGDPSQATWEDERIFKKQMLAKGVYLTSGEGLTSEYPGFMRFCFVKDEAEVRVGLKRLKEALDDYQGVRETTVCVR
jgi:1-aminocyclopropane-1-carboxylate synthase